MTIYNAQTDLDLPPLRRVEANFWKAKYLEAYHELVKANRALTRYSRNNKRLKSHPYQPRFPSRFS